MKKRKRKQKYRSVNIIDGISRGSIGGINESKRVAIAAASSMKIGGIKRGGVVAAAGIEKEGGEHVARNKAASYQRSGKIRQKITLHTHTHTHTTRAD